MNTSTYQHNGKWWVVLTLDGEGIDEAGPFDDEHDAEMMAYRTEKI